MSRHCLSALTLCIALAGSLHAEKAVLVSITDQALKTRVGPLINETPTSVTILDLKDGSEFIGLKSLLKKFEKNISDDTAIRTVGIAPVMGLRIAETSKSEHPVGRVAQVAQNTVYLTLGTASGISVGQKLNIYRKKSEIRDPATNKLLGVERSKISIVEITEVKDEFSKAKLASDLEVAIEVGDEAEPDRKAFMVAVMPFHSESGELLDVGVDLAEDLTTELVQKGVTVLERSVLSKVILELAVQNSALFDADTAQKIGKLAGASAVITGRIVAKGKQGTAYARQIDVTTGKIQYAVSGSMSLINANVIRDQGDKRPLGDSKPAAGSKASTRPLPKGSFRSTVIDLTDNAPANWIFKEARKGTLFWSDKNYTIAALPKEIEGGTVVLRDSGQEGWLPPDAIVARKECTAYVIMRWRYLGKQEISDVTLTQFTREGWDEVEGDVRSTFPPGEDWRWRAFKKRIDAGNVVLQLDKITWGKHAVLFVFK